LETSLTRILPAYGEYPFYKILEIDLMKELADLHQDMGRELLIAVNTDRIPTWSRRVEDTRGIGSHDEGVSTSKCQIFGEGIILRQIAEVH